MKCILDHTNIDETLIKEVFGDKIKNVDQKCSGNATTIDGGYALCRKHFTARRIRIREFERMSWWKTLFGRNPR